MDWRTWAPFQSKAVKDICDQMTEQEKTAVESFSKVTGILVAICFAIPVSFGVMLIISLKSIYATIALIVWIIIGIFILLHRRTKSKELLYSTNWAKSQGYTPDKI
jgi:hypothetical protein